MAKLMAPIPGMSLTREKGNAPWEQPPLYANPQEALAFYLLKLEDEDRLDDTLFILDNGLPLSTLIDSMTSYGVMEGYHTLDTKMILSPVLHEHLLSLCQAAGVNVVEEAGPGREERLQKRDEKRMLLLLEKALDEAPAPAELEEETLDEAEELLEEGGEEAPDEEMEELDAEGGEEALDSLVPRRM